MNSAQYKRILFLLSFIHCSPNQKHETRFPQKKKHNKFNEIYNILLFTHSLDGGLETFTELLMKTETERKRETKLETSSDDSKRTTIKLTS